MFCLRKARTSPWWRNFMAVFFVLQATICFILFVKLLTGGAGSEATGNRESDYAQAADAAKGGGFEDVGDADGKSGVRASLNFRDDERDPAAHKLSKQRRKNLRRDDGAKREEQGKAAAEGEGIQIPAPNLNQNAAATKEKKARNQDFKYLYPNEFVNSTQPGHPQRLRMKGTTFILNNPFMCKFGEKEESVNGSKPFPVLLVLIQSRRGNFLHREAIRNTFMSIRQHNGWDIRHMFLIGKGKRISSASVEEHQFQHIRLAWEFDTYGDIVTGPFRDTPDKFTPATTYQHVMGIRWALRYCKRAQYVVKANDDNFVDTLQIIENAIPKMKKTRASFLCSKRFFILNSPEAEIHKDVITKPGPSRPSIPYCSGEAYLADIEALKKIYLMIPRIPYVRTDRDDVYVTGRLRQAYIEYQKKQSSGEATEDLLAKDDGDDDILPILKVEHLEDHEEETCSYERNVISIEMGKMYFHKLPQPTSLLNEAWCFWKSTLEDKGLLKDYYERRFIFSAMAM